LTKLHTASTQGDNRHAPANTPGIRHVAFAVEDIDAVLAGLRARGAEFVGELERYEDSYRLCYVRGPEGIILELTEHIGCRVGPPPTNRATRRAFRKRIRLRDTCSHRAARLPIVRRGHPLRAEGRTERRVLLSRRGEAGEAAALVPTLDELRARWPHELWLLQSHKSSGELVVSDDARESSTASVLGDDPETLNRRATQRSYLAHTGRVEPMILVPRGELAATQASCAR
jgi:Glyoxalase/Bleomycin resistance protein/Dioxygenase superfamily